jgi:RHS repeat-associated protein
MTRATYTYAETGYANPHAVTSVGGTAYTYDNNGNVTSIGSLDYTWDWRNRLASAERSGGGVTTYGYDHTGQRVFKATGSATTSYPNRYYNVASSSLPATTTKHIFAPDGTLLATVEGSGVGTATTTYLHADHLEGTNVTTDEEGAISQTLDYYPYGDERIASGNDTTDRHYIGERYDASEDLNYLNTRYLQSSRGQFMSQDPMHLDIGDPGFGQRYNRVLKEYLADPQQMNSYGYARNNPIMLKDPSGLGPEAYFQFIGDLGTYDTVINLSNKYYDFRAALSNPNSSAVHKVSTGADFVWTSSLLLPGLAPISVPLFLWEGFKRGGEIITGVDLEEELEKRAQEQGDNTANPAFRSINPSIFQPNWNLFNVGNSTPTGNSRAGSRGGGTISIAGTNVPRSRDPVGIEKSGAPIFCWGACD